MKITDGIKVLEVSERAFNVIYKNHGFTVTLEQIDVKQETSTIKQKKKPKTGT